MNKKEFITAVAGYVDKYASAYGILVHSSVIAQAILESGWGKSTLAAKYHNYFGLFNGRMNKNEVEIYCKLDREGQQLMKEAFSVFQLTGRSYFKILKVARTIADLEGSYDIKSRHVEEALYFRQKGEGRVKVR